MSAGGYSAPLVVLVLPEGEGRLLLPSDGDAAHDD